MLRVYSNTHFYPYALNLCIDLARQYFNLFFPVFWTKSFLQSRLYIKKM